MSKPVRGKRTRARARGGATIKDVARRAGVSPMTVSRVVNGSEYVSDATRQSVQRAVRELRYSPNLAARNLASERGERLGLLYGNPSSAYLSEFLVGALDAASRHGVQLVLEKCEPRDGPCGGFSPAPWSAPCCRRRSVSRRPCGRSCTRRACPW